MANDVSPVKTESNAGSEASKWRVSITVMAEAKLPTGPYQVEATVTKRRHLTTNQWLPADVNWPCHGAVDPLIALAAAKVLAKAYLIATRLDKEVR